MNGAELLVRTLKELGADVVFGYPGGAIMPVYDVMPGWLNHILCRHEQGAAFAAQGFAKATGKPGVAIATSGPGATNLVTGIADAHMDSIPLLAITGQVPTSLIGTNAFQEIDIIEMTRGVVKASFQITDANNAASILTQAYHLCTSGRPGPVVVDFPKDIQLAEVTDAVKAVLIQDEPPRVSQETLRTFRSMLSKARNPVLIAGGGIKAANAATALVNFSDAMATPVTTTLNGMGLMPADHPNNLGMLGMHGTDAANDALQKSDLVIAIGARFDDRATGKVEGFAPCAKIIHVDIDPGEFNKNVATDLSIHADAGTFFDEFFRAAPAKTVSPLPSHNMCFVPPVSAGENINAPAVLAELGAHLDHHTYVTVDVGQHQMWAAQHIPFRSADQFMTSGGLGTMGFGLPAAIGVQIANPEAKVINITGDGSFMMNVQELATIKRYNLPVKIMILNNQHLGLVRQQQELFYGERYSSVDLSDNPDFAALAAVFGFSARTAATHDDARSAIDWLVAADGPALIELQIPAEENVWPFVVPGESNEVRLSDPRLANHDTGTTLSNDADERRHTPAPQFGSRQSRHQGTCSFQPVKDARDRTQAISA